MFDDNGHEYHETLRRFAPWPGEAPVAAWTGLLPSDKESAELGSAWTGQRPVLTTTELAAEQSGGIRRR